MERMGKIHVRSVSSAGSGETDIWGEGGWGHTEYFLPSLKKTATLFLVL